MTGPEQLTPAWSRSQIRLGEILDESWATHRQRPGRTLLTAAASALGIGVLVLTIGLSETITRQVSDQFDALKATEVVIRVAEGSTITIPLEAEASVSELAGVTAAGLIVPLGSHAVTRSAVDPGDPALSVEVVRATPGALDALGVTLQRGRLFDNFHQMFAAGVAVVGSGASERLGLGAVDGSASINIDGEPHVVLGIVDAVERRPAFSGAIIIPIDPAVRTSETSSLEELLIETAPGAAQTVAQQAALAISPQAPEQFSATAPPDPTTLRRGIEASVRSALFAVGATVLMIGLLGIGNASFISVLERTKEIGVRRAIGARPIHIWLQIMFEAGAVGAIGGTVGASLAIVGLVAVSASQGWTPTMSWVPPILGPAFGAIVGCAAGLLPARRALRIQPTEALRL